MESFDRLPFRGDIEAITLQNTYYRKVLHTTPQQQLVAMSLQPNEDIPMEAHPHTTQLIRIEAGRGIAIVDGKRKLLKDGVLIVVPPNLKHEIRNTHENQDLKLYSVYSPPEHARGTVHRRQSDVDDE